MPYLVLSVSTSKTSSSRQTCPASKAVYSTAADSHDRPNINQSNNVCVMIACLFLQLQIQTVSFSPAQFPDIKRGSKSFQLSSSGMPAGSFWVEFLAFLFHLQNVVLSFSHTVHSASSCGANDVKFSSSNIFLSVLLILHTLQHHHRKKVLETILNHKSDKSAEHKQAQSFGKNGLQHTFVFLINCYALMCSLEKYEFKILTN